MAIKYFVEFKIDRITTGSLEPISDINRAYHFAEILDSNPGYKQIFNDIFIVAKRGESEARINIEAVRRERMLTIGKDEVKILEDMITRELGAVTS